MSSTDRQELLGAMAEVMRVFMARAVLFQEGWPARPASTRRTCSVRTCCSSYGPATPGELAERAGLTAGGGITGVVDRLERAGLVRRSREIGDRRKVVISAEESRLAERIAKHYVRVGQRWAEHLATLNDEQLALAVDLFARAAEINHEETVRLRSLGPRAPAQP